MTEVYLGADSETYRIDGANFDKNLLYPPTENDVEFANQLKEHGLRLHGWYEPDFFESQKDSIFDPVEGIGLPVVSFRYFKTDKDGHSEPYERVIIWDGEGYGVHPGHAGQDRAQYLAGCQIGQLVDGKLKIDIPADGGRRNFSMDCIVGGDRGDSPVDAANR